jgi:hypothetical protein
MHAGEIKLDYLLAVQGALQASGTWDVLRRTIKTPVVL